MGSLRAVSRRLLLLLLVGIPVVALAGVLSWSFLRTPTLPELLPPPVSPLLPDLAMSPLTDVSAVQIEGGGDYVQFTAAVSNVGVGAFIVHAVRGDGRGPWRVSQRFDEPDGSTSETVTNGDVVWGGHGHDHWHVHLGASYWLTRPGSSAVLRSYDKVGFCFFDQRPLVTQPSTAPKHPQFPKSACNGHGTLEFTMGLSPGWGDPYPWALPDQRLLLTGLRDGVYRLWATADPGRWFREAERDEQRHVARSPRAASDDPSARRGRPPGARGRPDVARALARAEPERGGGALRHRRTARRRRAQHVADRRRHPDRDERREHGQRREAETHDPYLTLPRLPRHRPSPLAFVAYLGP